MSFVNMSTFQSKGATFIMIKAVNKYYQQNDKDAKKTKSQLNGF